MRSLRGASFCALSNLSAAASKSRWRSRKMPQFAHAAGSPAAIFVARANSLSARTSSPTCNAARPT